MSVTIPELLADIMRIMYLLDAVDSAALQPALQPATATVCSDS